MLIDLHAHSSAISRCCRIPIDTVLEVAKANGMDGIALTNHYQKCDIQERTIDEYVNDYIEEYYTAKKAGDELGIKVFFGIEVTLELYPKVHMLIYGVEPEFLKKYPLLFDMSQEELFELAKQNNGLLIQAHPYRGGTSLMNINYLDGIEINCHPLYEKAYSEELFQIAIAHKLILTCGGDYHADTYRPKCGMYLPDKANTTDDLRSYLMAQGEKVLCVQEPNCDAHTMIFIQ